MLMLDILCLQEIINVNSIDYVNKSTNCECERFFITFFAYRTKKLNADEKNCYLMK
jgi:hypothetical protein